NEPPGGTSQFREILVDIDASLHDLRGDASTHGSMLADDDYSAGQLLGEQLRNVDSQGVVYASAR
ncbi:MAG: RES family NAD+ phosphorylase, partial [Methylococcales bacterium]|nr:RES family NAD+ phosphorylase [Methylococcales bacterium]